MEPKEIAAIIQEYLCDNIIACKDKDGIARPITEVLVDGDGWVILTPPKEKDTHSGEWNRAQHELLFR